MSKTIAQRRKDREEFEHAVTRVGSLLLRAPRTTRNQPIMNMFTKNWNRDSGTFTIQVLVVIKESGDLVDISTEVATILQLRYSQKRRGVMIQSIGTNAHHLIAVNLAAALYGRTRGDDLGYVSH